MNSKKTPPESEGPTAGPKDDPVAEAVLSAIDGGKSVTFKDVAMAIAEQRRRPKDGPELWRRYLTAVKQQARHLARQGRIEIVRKGEVVDPDDFKGIVRIRQKAK